MSAKPAARFLPLAIFAALALLLGAGVWLSRNPDREALPSPLIDKAAPRRSSSVTVRVVGFNWKDDRTDALRWLDHFGNPYWLVIADLEGKTAIDWGIYGAPETFLVDANGVIRWKHVGPLTDALIAGELLPALEAIDPQQAGVVP